jgi:hypothetical protein
MSRTLDHVKLDSIGGQAPTCSIFIRAGFKCGGVYQVKTLKVHMVFFFLSIEFAVLFNGLKVENVYCILLQYIYKDI